MGKYKLTTIRTTLATSKRLNQLKKQIGAKSIDELLTTLMNMYKIHEFSEEDIQQLSICNDLIKPLVSDVDPYLRIHDLVWKGEQVVGIEKEKENENKEIQ